MFLLCRGSDSWDGREGEDGDEEEGRGAVELHQVISPYTFKEGVDTYFLPNRGTPVFLDFLLLSLIFYLVR